MAGLADIRAIAFPRKAARELTPAALLRALGTLLLALALPVGLLAMWQWLSQTGRINDIFFPPPTVIAETSWRLITSGDLLQQSWVSAVRIVVGFMLGAVPGVAVGLGIGLSRAVRIALYPTITALYPIPRIAVLPLVILVFGLTEESKLFMVAFSVFFLVVINTVAGVRSIDPVLFDVARSFRASRWRTYLSVALSGSLPFIVAGAKLGIGFAFIVSIGTEFLIPGDGIGSLIWRSYQVLDMDTMYVGLAATVVLGWMLIVIVDLLERLLIRWRPER
jgi:NitT/TauT family transport system permease protein